MTENSSAPKKETFVFKYALSCCAATVAESVTYPMDLTKTRLQIQGEGGLATAKKRGFIRTAYGIATEEGVHKLWQGVTPAVYRHYVYTGCRLGFYEYIRENFLGKNTDGTFSLWKAVVSGMTAGALAQFIASPMDLVKVQMQMEGRRLLEGQKPRYKGTLHAFTSIAKQGGVRGLWRGWIPNVQRAALVNLGDLTTYDTAKHLILVNTSLPDAPLLHSIASACSGLISAVLSTPADVVKTRIMNQMMSSGPPVYKGSVDCFIKTVRHEGFFALYKGFLPIWARMAPWSLTFWLSYEQIRKAAGTSSF
ncbi:hypothetical protein CAPTEDRAFT_151682 [Capitella teleta]|uniref:Mitochondrial uncoupling protein 4 n=1 Tax=Capitella teleta TaxID=283909 RepID=R7TY10_CAPTE|nr:hypothetical protein CAPTEDRAFT_151682 [Capitella teleta]|eukprot:ELT96296.1 hypothetical protein CAPTEDRAFT_151682 [Capitella teleta]